MKNPENNPFQKKDTKKFNVLREDLDAINERISVRAVAGSNVLRAAEQSFPHVKLSAAEIERPNDQADGQEEIIAAAIAQTPPTPEVQPEPYHEHPESSAPVVDLAAAREAREAVQDKISQGLQATAADEAMRLEAERVKDEHQVATMLEEARKKVGEQFPHRPTGASSFGQREAA